MWRTHKQVEAGQKGSNERDQPLRGTEMGLYRRYEEAERVADAVDDAVVYKRGRTHHPAVTAWIKTIDAYSKGCFNDFEENF